MSPRAAARLESLGFEEVYDYVAGKADWRANGLPIEGRQADDSRAGDLALPNIPTCQLDTPTGDILDRMHQAGWDACAVVDDDQVVLGLVRRHALDDTSGKRAAEIMEDGPSTFRPSASLKGPLGYMERHDVESVLITTNRGRLLGGLRRVQAEDAAGERQAPRR